MIKPFMNGEKVPWNDTELELTWVRPELPPIEMHVAGYGPKVLAIAGRHGDGVIIQLADPDIIQWTMDTARKAAEEAGRDPAALKCIVCAPSHISDDIAAAREQVRWFPAMVSNHVRDLIRRYGADGSVVPKALTDYVPDETHYDYDEHSRVGAKHGAFVSDEICDRFCVLGTPEQAREKLARARGDRRGPVQHLSDDRGPGAHPRDLREGDHPGSAMRKLIRGGTVVNASEASVADVLVDGEEILAVGSVGRRRRGGDRRKRLLRAARADRQPHAHGHAVRRHALDRRLRHRHARRRRGRDDLHRRLRHPAGAGRPALLARGMAGPRRRRRARGLRLPHGDHERRRRHLRRHGADGRGGPLLVQGLPRLQGRADGHRRPVLPRARDHARPRRAHDGALRERLGDRRARRARARGRPDGPDLSRVHAAGDPRGGGHLPLRAARGARRRGRLHRARDLRDGRGRDHEQASSAASTCRARPASSTSRTPSRT